MVALGRFSLSPLPRVLFFGSIADWQKIGNPQKKTLDNRPQLCYNIVNEREVIEMKNDWYLILAIISMLFIPMSPWFIISALTFALIWNDKEEEKEWENLKKSIDN